MINRFLDLLFPPKCLLCGNITQDSPYCGCCVGDEIPADHCPVCRQEYADCHCSYAFTQICSPFFYQNRIKSAILSMKTESDKSYAEFFAAQMMPLFRQHFADYQIAAVVPVPAKQSTIRERGFNQAEKLAAALAKRAELPMRIDLLIRLEESQPQHNLPLKERLYNAQQSYKRNPSAEMVAGNFLLVDDVCTTGATLDACSRILLELGAQSVCVLTASATLLQSVRM